MTEKRFRIIPFYTGDETIDEVLKNQKSLNLLWLEILFNDRIPWEHYMGVPEIRMAYNKACVWYSHFKTMVNSAIKRRALEEIEGKIDDSEYRRFLEALNFVTR